MAPKGVIRFDEPNLWDKGFHVRYGQSKAVSLPFPLPGRPVARCPVVPPRFHSLPPIRNAGNSALRLLGLWVRWLMCGRGIFYLLRRWRRNLVRRGYFHFPCIPDRYALFSPFSLPYPYIPLPCLRVLPRELFGNGINW